MMPETPNHPRRTLAIVAAVGLTLLVAVVALVASSGGVKTAGSSPTPSARTGEATPTPTPSNPALAPSAPTYTGFDNLSTYGVTSDQLDAAKYAFVKFAHSTSLTLTSVDLDTNSLVVQTHNRNSANTTDYANFKVTLNGGTQYQAKFAFVNLTSGRLYLSDMSGKAVYDSGTLDLYKGIGD